MPDEREAALKAVGDFILQLTPDRSLAVSLVAYTLTQRREAVEQARPEIERKATIKALEWAWLGVHDCDTEFINAEITRLKAEGGE